MGIRSFFVGLVVLFWASVASATGPVVGLEAVLRCGPAGQPADLMDCLGDGTVEISRDGEKRVVSGPGVLLLGQCDDEGLHIHGPKYFSIQARNVSPDHQLSLVVRRNDGRTLFEQTARRYATVTFYRCGPTVEFQCREYNYDKQK